MTHEQLLETYLKGESRLEVQKAVREALKTANTATREGVLEELLAKAAGARGKTQLAFYQTALDVAYELNEMFADAALDHQVGRHPQRLDSLMGPYEEAFNRMFDRFPGLQRAYGHSLAHDLGALRKLRAEHPESPRSEYFDHGENGHSGNPQVGL